MDVPDSTHAVHCAGLVKRYEDVLALDGLDLEVSRGECFGLLGPNGAGKTTTVEIMEGLTVPDAGSVTVLGKHWGGAHDQELRERIGVQLQETQLADKLTVEETIRLFRSFYRRGRAVDEVVELVGLEPKRRGRVHKLSGGQKQRLALACALVGAPDLLFLDEPTTGLDPQARLKVWDVIARFRAEGGTILLTTHYMEEAERLCDRVAIVDRGRLIAQGTPADLVASLEAEQIVELRARHELDPTRLAAVAGVSGVTRQSDGWRLRVSSIGQALPTLLAEIERQSGGVESLTTHEPTLEDVFVSRTGRGLRDA
jgi:ABC-2 type transport system ATP-binding protein